MTTETITWHWIFPGGTWGFLAISLLVVTLVWLAYARTLRRLSPGWRVVLTVMRSLMLILLLTCLAMPQRIDTKTFKRDLHRPIAVVVDASGSMVRPDARKQTRLDLAQQALARIWDASGQMKLFTFADKLQPLATPEALKGMSDPQRETHLLSSLRQVLYAAPQGGWGAVVAFTDGNDTTSETSDETGRHYREGQTPLILAATQSDLQQPDAIHLAAVTVPPVNTVGTDYPLDVFVQSETNTSHEVTVRVLQNNQSVMESAMTVSPGTHTQKHTFHFTEQTPGPRDYQVQLFDEGKTEPADQMVLCTLIVDKQKVRALYYSGSLSVEYRFVRAALAQNPSIELEGAVRVNATALRRQVLYGNGSRTSQDAENFPKTVEALNQYDVIVLADLLPSQLDEQQVNALLEYVKSGGGLIFLVSNSVVASDFSGSPLEQLLPVIFEPKEPDAASAQPSGASRLLQQLNDLASSSDNHDPDQPDTTDRSSVVHLVKMDFTPDGRSVLGALGSQSDEAAPMFREYAAVQRAKPGAIIAAQHPDDADAWGKRPLLAMQHFGEGRSAVLATDSIWRWQLGLPSSSHAYGKLWQQMMLWVAHQGAAAPEIELASSCANQGDKVPVKVKLPPRFPSVDPSRVILQARLPDGSAHALPLNPGIHPGTYDGSVTAEATPWVRLEATVEGLNPGAAMLNVRSHHFSPEEEHLAVDLPALQRLAAAAGGQVVNAASLRQIPTQAIPTEEATTEKKVDDLWNNSTVLAFVLGFFCVELVLRRRLKLL